MREREVGGVGGLPAASSPAQLSSLQHLWPRPLTWLYGGYNERATQPTKLAPPPNHFVQSLNSAFAAPR